MKLSIISFTNHGLELSKRVAKSLVDIPKITTAIYTKCSRIKRDATKPAETFVDESIMDWTREQIQEKTAILFIGATGIAVRAIAPNLTDKLHDSPILVMDEQGRYVIPLLSGHMGGANALAMQIAEKMKAVPVITTATDIQNKFAVDVFAKKNGLHILNKDGIAKVSAKVLAGEELTMFVEPGHLKEATDIPKEIRLIPHLASAPTILVPQTVDIVIAQKTECLAGIDALLRLQPKEYMIGMGCKRGVPLQNIETLIGKTLQEVEIGREQIFALASIDKKKDEQGFLVWSRQHRIPFLTYTAEELQKVQGNFHASEFVKSQVGVDNVCERAALCACGEGGRLVYEKHTEAGITIAVAKREWSIGFDEA